MLQSLPDGVLPFLAADDDAELFREMIFCRQIGELALPAVADDKYNFVNERRAVEAPPGLRDERLPGYGQKQFVRFPAHPRAFAGGYD
jgi:hypothetical protein